MKKAMVVGIIVVLIAAGVTIAIIAHTQRHGANSGDNLPSGDAMLIVPGQSVGKIQKSMTTNEVEAVLGKPERWQGKIMVYDKSFGMSVSPTKAGVMVVFCGDSMLKYPGVKAFNGRTKEGIGMESSRQDVIKAFGQPTSAKPWSAAIPPLMDAQEQIEYKNLGLTFILESGKVINITVDFRKPQ
jgi:hypothetical protein